MSDPRYPVGRFEAPGVVTPEQRADWIRQVEALPGEVRRAVDGLSDEQLDHPYRDGGWTLRQVVHHLADSHLNAYTRFKLALTEEAPTIKPYEEKAWAELPDSRGPLAPSLALLDGLHARWADLLRSLDAAQLERTFVHPERGVVRLDRTLGMYAWHGRHHVAHITTLRGQKGW